MLDRRGGLGLSGAVFTTGVIALAVLAGLAPGLLPLTLTLALAAAAALVLAGVTVHRLLADPRHQPAPGVTPKTAQPLESAEGDASEPVTLRTARLLFYLGTITVTQYSWRVVGGLTISEVAFIAAFALCCFAVIRGSAVARVPGTLIAGVTLFAVGGAISSLGAISPPESFTVVAKAIYVMLLWVWTGAMVLRTRQAVITALTLWAVSAAVNGIGAIAQAAGVLSGFADSRALGFTTHPNDLGGAEGIALVPALMVAARSTGASGPVAAARWLLPALVAAGLLLSASIAGMIAAFVAFVVLAERPRRSRAGPGGGDRPGGRRTAGAGDRRRHDPLAGRAARGSHRRAGGDVDDRQRQSPGWRSSGSPGRGSRRIRSSARDSARPTSSSRSTSASPRRTSRSTEPRSRLGTRPESSACSAC